MKLLKPKLASKESGWHKVEASALVSEGYTRSAFRMEAVRDLADALHKTVHEFNAGMTAKLSNPEVILAMHHSLSTHLIVKAKIGRCSGPEVIAK